MKTLKNIIVGITVSNHKLLELYPILANVEQPRKNNTLTVTTK